MNRGIEMITLQQLQYFRELAANGHLTRTAEQLFISQTTLSGTIIKLEKQLGINLFDRVGRTLSLNETGQGYLVYVEQALTALENGQAFIADRREQGAHKVSLSIINSAVWSPLIQNFQTRFPKDTNIFGNVAYPYFWTYFLFLYINGTSFRCVFVRLIANSFNAHCNNFS